MAEPAADSALGSEVKTYTASALDAATHGFARENSLGRGGVGTGYSGEIDGQAVLVMKLIPDPSRQAKERFRREITVLSRAVHPHVLKMLGFDDETRCIVYEAVPGGNLEDLLATEAGRRTLKQKDRFRIAAEVAEALLFLHNLEPYPILHQDVKPANVLLDSQLSSKMASTGLAKFLPPNDSSVWGTVGYIDPLLLRTGKYGPQSDVYGLGLVVLQLLTGEKVNKVLDHAKFGVDGIMEHLDKTTRWTEGLAQQAAELALRCREKVDRPDLAKVVLPTLQKLSQESGAEVEVEDSPAVEKGEEHEHSTGDADSKGKDKKKGMLGFFFGRK